MITRITKLTIVEQGKPLFDETATHVEIVDDAAGEYITVDQPSDDAQPGQIRINPEEWPALRKAINKLVKDCGPLPQ